jgi:hypothetical protein
VIGDRGRRKWARLSRQIVAVLDNSTVSAQACAKYADE